MTTSPLKRSLSIYDPDKAAPPPQVDDQVSLRQAFERYLLPDLLHGPKNTLRQYRGALTWWETTTSDPPIAKIDDDVVREWRDNMCASPSVKSPETVKKTWSHLRAILRRLGDRNYGNAAGRGVISYVPFVDLNSLPLEKGRPARVIPFDDLDCWYRGCRVARFPTLHTRSPAPLVQRSLLVLGFFTGLRKNDLIKLRRTSLILDQHSACPAPELQVTSRYGWLVLLPGKTKKYATRRTLYLPLHEIAWRHLVALDQTKQVFGGYDSPDDWDNARRDTQRAEGILDPYTFPELRKTCGVTWAGAPNGRGLDRHVLGHAPRDVTERHYQNAVADMAQIISGVPYPPEFERGLSELPTRGQRTLF